MKLVWETQEPYQPALTFALADAYRPASDSDSDSDSAGSSGNGNGSHGSSSSSDSSSSSGSASGGSAAVVATLRGFAIEHYSKSVANNYGVYIQTSGLALEGCSVKSSSGSGVGIEGASARLLRCSIAGCARHGLAVFGSLEGDSGVAQLENCEVRAASLLQRMPSFTLAMCTSALDCS